MQVRANESLLKNALVNDLITRLRKGDVPFVGSVRATSMASLKRLRPVAYCTALACLYDIAVYRVTGEGVTEGCPPEEIGQFFVSTVSGQFENAPTIPLQATEQEGFVVACALLGLEQLFEAECFYNTTLPRQCPEAPVSITTLMPHIITQVRAYDTLDVNEMHMKVSEETGELGTAILVERGKLPGKVLNEPAMGEGADVIIATISTLAKHYPDLSPEELSAELTKWVNFKMGKYEAKLLRNAELAQLDK
jgi:hypothetical protein